MRADDEYLLQVLAGEKQYIVPVFQRRYSWKKKHWEDLWRDIQHLLEEESLSETHFVGTLVCMPGEHTPGRVPDYILIDGQQRLATFSIILCAIRDHARVIGEDDNSKDLKKFAEEIHTKR